jgi:hypothetical protein
MGGVLGGGEIDIYSVFFRDKVETTPPYSFPREKEPRDTL